MNILSAFLKGITYSFSILTPLSYSGHESLFNFMDMNLTKGGCDSILPILALSSSIASIVYFLRKDLAGLFFTSGSLLKDIKEKKLDINTKDADKKTLLMVIFASFVLILMPLFSWLFKGISSNLLIAAIGFLISAAFVYMSNNAKEKNLKESNETILNAMAMALFKVISVIPGISGVGGMYFAGLFSGMKRETTIRLSWLITLVWAFFSLVVSIISLFVNGVNVSFGVFYYIFVFLGALGASGFSMYLFNLSVKYKKTHYFLIYNIVISIITFVIWLRG